MNAEQLMRKYKYGYVHSKELLEEPFVKDLIKENKQQTINRNLYELEKENEELKRYIGFLETKCKEYEKHYDIEIQYRNSSQPMPYIMPNKVIAYDTEIIRIPERKFLVGCKDLSKIREMIQELEDKYF